MSSTSASRPRNVDGPAPITEVDDQLCQGILGPATPAQIDGEPDRANPMTLA